MKAERRKELKTNELIHSLQEIAQSIRDHAVQIVLVIVVAAVVLGLGAYWRQAKVTRLQEGWSQLNRLRRGGFPDEQTVQSLRDLAADHTDPALVASANQLLGDSLLDQITTSEQALNEMAKQAALSEAERAYQRAASTGGASSVARGVAMVGLAKIAEHRGQWDQARQGYQRVIDDPDLPGAYKIQAQADLDDLDALGEPVLFVAAPAGEPTEAVEPAETTEAP